MIQAHDKKGYISKTRLRWQQKDRNRTNYNNTFGIEWKRNNLLYYKIKILMGQDIKNVNISKLKTFLKS